jgi:hypothetical protein
VIGFHVGLMTELRLLVIFKTVCQATLISVPKLSIHMPSVWWGFARSVWALLSFEFWFGAFVLLSSVIKLGPNLCRCFV